MQKNIGVLDITMNHFQISHYFDSFENLSENNLNFFLRKYEPMFEKRLKVPAVAIIHDQIEVIFCLYRFMQPYYMITQRQIT